MNEKFVIPMMNASKDTNSTLNQLAMWTFHFMFYLDRWYFIVVGYNVKYYVKMSYDVPSILE